MIFSEFSDSSNVTFEVRIVKAHNCTTAACRVRANEVKFLSVLFEATADALAGEYGWLVSEFEASRSDSYLYVQDTFSNKDRKDGKADWKRIRCFDQHAYADWFEDVVLYGSEDVVRIEVHFNAGLNIFTPASVQRWLDMSAERRSLRLISDKAMQEQSVNNNPVWVPGTNAFFAGRAMTTSGEPTTFDTQVSSGFHSHRIT